MSFEGDAFANRRRLEIQRGQEADSRRLAQYPGLEETLYRYCDSTGLNSDGTMDEEATELRGFGKSRLFQLLASDENAREVVRSFLGREGRGYERNREKADGLREQLAWEVIDYLTQQKH